MATSEGVASCFSQLCKVKSVSIFNLVKIVTPCSISFSFLAGPWWDSEMEYVQYCILYLWVICDWIYENRPYRHKK